MRHGRIKKNIPPVLPVYSNFFFVVVSRTLCSCFYVCVCVGVCAKERKMCMLSPYVPLLDSENCSHADFFFESLRHDDEMNLTDIT